MAAREARERADALLVERLSEEQRQDFARSKSFLVVTPAGRRYRLHADRVNFQADLLAPESEYVLASYCVQPRDSLVPKSDSLLSQMLLLQADEARFLLTANVNLKVSSLHRYLNGEIRPRAPEARSSEVERQAVGLSRREEAAQRIRGSYLCPDHSLPCAVSRETDDGRGLDLHYACGCPPRYVSFRQFEQREQAQRDRATQTEGRRTDAETENILHHATIRPVPPTPAVVAAHNQVCDCRSWSQEYSWDRRAYVFGFACGARETVSAQVCDCRP